MWGIGDNIHLRAVLREMTKTEDVWLETSNPAIFHDLDVKIVQSRLRPPRIRESIGAKSQCAPDDALRRRVSYDVRSITKLGSVLAAQFASCGVEMPEVPDFRLSVPAQWTTRMLQLLPERGRPLMVYRPIVQNKVWPCPLRSPRPEVYDELFRSVRDKFFVVSVADLSDKEWIVGPEPDVDLRLHHGELDFEMMAALFAQASIAFTNPGFSPILAQAVGTPTVITYGGYECHTTTHAHGARLTSTLPIDTKAPCRCFWHGCQKNCSKQIELESALVELQNFINKEVLS